MNKERKEKIKRLRLIKLSVIVFLIVIFIAITIPLIRNGTDIAFKTQLKDVKEVKSEREILGNKKVKIYKDKNGYWNIEGKSYDGKISKNDDISHKSLLKVIQLTDIHLGSGIKSIGQDKKSLIAVQKLIEWAEPDLIVVTGDALYPVPFTAGSINNGRAAKNFATFMDKFKIPWAFVYGNHDTENYATNKKEEVSKILLESSYNGKDKFCLYQEGPKNFLKVKGGETPLGNYPILIRDENSKLVHVMMFMDSNKYNKESDGPMFFKYDNIHKDQALWYSDTIKKISIENGYSNDRPVTSSLYFHIPIKQYKEAWLKVTDDHIEKEEDKRKKKINKEINKENNIKYFGGDMQEYTRDPKDTTISCSTLDAPIWDEILKTKSTKFLFCGHDHDNNFSIEYKGIRLTYGKSIDYQAYPGISKRTFQRGATLILLTGQDEKESVKIYQKKYAMLNNDQISDYNSVKNRIEDVYLNTENPKMMHPLLKIKLIAFSVIISIALCFVYLIVRKIVKYKKLKKEDK